MRGVFGAIVEEVGMQGEVERTRARLARLREAASICTSSGCYAGLPSGGHANNTIFRKFSSLEVLAMRVRVDFSVGRRSRTHAFLSGQTKRRRDVSRLILHQCWLVAEWERRPPQDQGCLNQFLH